MNINQHMNELGQIGSVGYTPTESVIDGLLSRTKRARAVRQGSAAVVGSVSAVALGVIGVQVYVTIDHRNDAATQDRNLIENGLPGIFDFDAQYGSGYTGMDEASKEAFDKIYEDLNIAAQIDAKHLAEQQAADAAAAAAAAAAASAGGDTTTTCVYEEHPWEGGIKYRSPETGCQWVYPDTSDKFYNPWSNSYETCTGSSWTAPGGIGSYSCSTKKWTLAAGYFQFGNNEIYKCENWTDAATGGTFQGAISNNPVSGSFNGEWAQKRIYCTVGTTYTRTLNQSSDYEYMGGELASWGSHVCTGSTVNVWGATQRYSCLRENELWAKYGTWTANMSGGSNPWTQNNSCRKILVDPVNFKWFTPCCSRYYNIALPPEGWYWTGTAWAEVVPDPEPDPDPSPPTE